jgi:hypothetical protein
MVAVDVAFPVRMLPIAKSLGQFLVLTIPVKFVPQARVSDPTRGSAEA